MPLNGEVAVRSPSPARVAATLLKFPVCFGPNHNQMRVLTGAGSAAMALEGDCATLRPHLISDIRRHPITVPPPQKAIGCGLELTDDFSLPKLTTNATITASGNRG